MSSFLLLPETEQQEEDAVLEQLHGETMDWPTIENEPLSEFTTPFLATLSFPALFPNGDADPTNPAILREVSFAGKVKHLIKYGRKLGNKWTFPFSSHPRFSYWALNMIQRKRMLQQASVFIKQNPGEAHLTSEELRQLVESNNVSALLSKVFRYATNITGTPSYWHKVRSDMKAVITQVGPLTFFFTFSAADMHWPELDALFGDGIDMTISETRQNNVLNNPHIVDYFFTQRVENFINHWLYKTLDALCHWYRHEYQGRATIHSHGVAK